MTHDVFISHSAKDKAKADAVCAELESRNIRCWVAPRNIRPGADWGEAIIDAISKSRVMVLILSSGANDSPQVKREVERAVNKNVVVVPLRIEDVQPSGSLEYFLSTQHWVDASTPPFEKHLEQMAESVRSLLDDLATGSKQEQTAGPKVSEHETAQSIPRQVHDTVVEPKASGSKAKATSVEDSAHDNEMNEGDNSAEILGKIQECLSGVTNNKIFVGNMIPPAKVKNAIHSYAPGVSPESVLLLYDNTFLGEAKDGLLLTVDAIYWKTSLWTKPNQIRYSEIQNASFDGSLNSIGPFVNPVGGASPKIMINGQEIELYRGGDLDKLAGSLANVIRYLKSR